MHGMTEVPRIWFCLETGDYWFGSPPYRDRSRLTLYRASDVRYPMDLQQAARLLADNEEAMSILAYYSGAPENRLHSALDTLARNGIE
jgi:hypothetical protein